MSPDILALTVTAAVLAFVFTAEMAPVLRSLPTVRRVTGRWTR